MLLALTMCLVSFHFYCCLELFLLFMIMGVFPKYVSVAPCMQFPQRPEEGVRPRVIDDC